MKYKHEAIFCVVNAGFSDSVMETAKAFGASGGTVIHARGTANSEAERLYEITVQPEKEIVMILVPTELKDDILTALYRSVGLKSPGQGIAFSMPVDAAVGLSGGNHASAADSAAKKERSEKPEDPSTKKEKAEKPKNPEEK